MNQAKQLLRTLGILSVVLGVLVMVGAIAGELPPVGGVFAGETLEPDAADESENASGTDVTNSGESNSDEAENTSENSATESAAERESQTANVATETNGEVAQLVEPDENTEETANAEEPGNTIEVAGIQAQNAQDSTQDEAQGVGASVSALAGIRRYRVCDGEAGGTAISSGDILGDARLETLVACGRVVHVLGDLEGELLRIGRVQLGGTGPARPATPVVADLTGDGASDLILGFATLDGDGSPSGGALAVAIRSPYGGIDSARILAPIPATHVVAAPLLSDAIDLAALNWTDNHGRRPSEIWVFSGGPSPARRARLTLNGQGVGLNTGDMNGDGRLDLLAIDDSGLRSIAGPQFRAVDEARGGARALFRGDVNGDGQDDTLVQSESGLTLYLSGQNPPNPAGEERTIEGTTINIEGEVRHAALGDVNGDELMDLVVATDRWLRVLTRNANGFTEIASSPLPSLAEVEAIAVARPYALLLLKNGSSVEVVRLPLSRRGEVDESTTATPVRDSPLVLNVTIE